MARISRLSTVVQNTLDRPAAMLFPKRPLGHEPDADGVVVFPDLAATALDGLLHEADFDAGGVGEFATDADEGAVLVKHIAADVAAEVDEDFIPEREVGALGFREGDGGAQHVSKAVFVSPVADVPVAVFLGHLADPALLQA